MSNLSFEIRTSEHFLKKLLEEGEEFYKNLTSSRIAINCAMTAWHLSDWTYHEYKSSHFKSLHAYQEYLKGECPYLQIMHDITNGSKHFTLNRHSPKTTDTNLKGGGFSSGFSRGFNISRLQVAFGGKTIYFDNVLDIVLLFWKDYFIKDLQIQPHLP